MGWGVYEVKLMWFLGGILSASFAQVQKEKKHYF